MRRHILLLLLLMSAASLAGCFGSSAVVPPDHYYRLPERPNVTKLPQPLITGLLGIKRLRAEGILSERSIVFVEDNSAPVQLQHYYYHHWAEAPVRLIQDDMLTYFRAAGVADKIVRFDAVKAPEFVVSGELLRLERLLNADGAEVVVRMVLRYSDGSRRKLYVHGDYMVRQKAGDKSMHSTVEAFAQALGKIYSAFIRDLQGQSS